MATINASQDYDFISTLTFASASGTCRIEFLRGDFNTVSGTAYYRTGTSGSWTSLSVSGGSTTFPVGATTMQVAHDWNKSGNDYLTQSLADQSTNLTEITISQKAVISGVMGNYFMFKFAHDCPGLVSCDVPDTSGLTSAGTFFMGQYASESEDLDLLSVPDTSGLTSVDDGFFSFYANECNSLISLAIPDTSNITSVGLYFTLNYARNCSSLERLELPAVGWFASNNINWSVPSGRLNNVKGYVKNSTDLSDWQDLVVSGETLYTNYVRDTDDVILESINNSNFLTFM